MLFLLSVQWVAGQEKENSAADQAKHLWGGFASLGYAGFTGNMSDYFSGQITLPITFDYSYKNLLIQINLDAGYGKVSKTLTFSDGSQWKEGENVWSNALGMNIGFSPYQTSGFRLTPYVGYANFYMAKYWWSSSEIRAFEPSNYYYNMGILLDFKKVFASTGNKYDGYGAIRVSIGYYMSAQDDDAYPQYYNGSVFYLSVGVAVVRPWDMLKESFSGD